MINALKSTNQIVFIGYSLPSDDVDYITLFRNILANNPNVKVKVVLYDENLNKNEFNILNNNSYQLLNPNTKEVVNRYKNLFGKDVLFNFSGSPQCFLNDQLYK